MEAHIAQNSLLNAAAVWAGSAVLAGWIVRRPGLAVLGGTLSLFAAVVGYYCYGVWFGDRTAIGLAGLSGALKFWLAMAVVAGPLVGLAGAAARRRDIYGLLAFLLVPAAVVVEILVRFRLARRAGTPWARSRRASETAGQIHRTMTAGS